MERAIQIHVLLTNCAIVNIRQNIKWISNFNKKKLWHDPNLHEDFANNNIIIILEDCAKYDSDTITFCFHIPNSEQTHKNVKQITYEDQPQTENNWLLWSLP